VEASGALQRIGEPLSELSYRVGGKKQTVSRPVADHESGLKLIMDALTDSAHGGLADISAIGAVGHRVVHGGEAFAEPVLITDEVERVSDEYAQRSHDRLSSNAEEAVINPLRSRELTGREEAMILNGAYLVAEEQLLAFRAELESLEEEHSHLGFSYEMTGPWPPYNFVSTCTEPSRSIGLEEGAADE